MRKVYKVSIIIVGVVLFCLAIFSLFIFEFDSQRTDVVESVDDSQGDVGMLAHFNLDAWWRLEADFVDSSGNNHNGTSATAPAFEISKFGRGADFDGNNDYIAVRTLNDATTTFTVGSWIKTSNINGTIISDWERRLSFPTAFYGFKVGLYAGRKLTITIGTGPGTTSQTSVGVLGDNVWTHWVMTYNQTTKVAGCYINGEKTTLLGLPLGTLAQNRRREFIIGRSQQLGNYVNVDMDEVVLFDSVLGEQDVKRVMLNMHPLR